MPHLHVSRGRSPASRRVAGSAVLAAVMAAVILAGCGKGQEKAAAAPAGAAPPPPEVGVVVATPGDIGLVTELPGRLEASRIAQVRARAAGILQERLFREGSDVKAGQPLFRIDASPLTAQQYAVRSIPTLVLLRGGKEVKRQPGAIPAQQIVAFATT